MDEWMDGRMTQVILIQKSSSQSGLCDLKALAADPTDHAGYVPGSLHFAPAVRTLVNRHCTLRGPLGLRRLVHSRAGSTLHSRKALRILQHLFAIEAAQKSLSLYSPPTIRAVCC